MRKQIFFIFVLVLTVTFLFSETISLEQVRALALANSRSLANYNINIRSSVLEEKSQLYTILPSVSANYSASMDYLDKDWHFINPVDTFDSSARLSITQTLFNGGKNFIQKAINELNSESQRKAALAEYFKVLESADNAYYAMLESMATLEAAESALTNTLSNLSIAEIRQSNGMINQGDYLKALAEKESQENSRNQARRSLSLNVTKLKNLIGAASIPQPEQIDFSRYEGLIQYFGSISDEDASTLYDRFWKIITQANPSLAMAALNSQKAEKNLSSAKRDSAPVVTATLISGSIGYSTEKGFGTSSTGRVEISGKIPLDFWNLSNKIEKNKIAVNSAGIDYIDRETQLETSLLEALINAFTQADSVLSSRRSLEYTQKHYEYVEERYRLSQSSVSELGEASSLLIDNRNKLIQANYGFLQKLSALRSLGAIDDEERLINLLMGNKN